MSKRGRQGARPPRKSTASRAATDQRSERTRAILIIFVAIVAMTLPFARKAFNVDEPLFVWAAQHVQLHPTDPYGFDVNWYGKAEPMRDVMQNPPLTSYCIAAAAAFVGWNEFGLHLAFSLFAVAAITGTWILAKRLSPSPWIASAIAAFSPVFLVCALTVMSDVAMSACFICAVAAWVAGIEGKRQSLLWVAAALVTASGFFKYFGIALVPLLLAYTFAKERKLTRNLIPLAAPIAAFAAYDIFGRMTSGRGLLSGAMGYAVTTKSLAAATYFDKLVIDLAFAGACVVASVVFVPLFARGWWLAAVGCAAVAGAFSAMHMQAIAPALWGSLPPATAAQFALAMAGGVMIVCLCVNDCWRSRSAESLLLVLWVAGTLYFAGFVNWTLAARSFVPLIAPVALLISRELGRTNVDARLAAAAVVACCVITLVAAGADAQFANASRTAARQIFERYGGDPHTKWFEGHWGFQYYMTQVGGVPADVRTSVAHGKDLWFTPTNSSAVFETLPPNRLIDTIALRGSFPMSVMNRESRAGFYSDYMGPMPYVFGRPPTEKFYVRRLGRP